MFLMSNAVWGRLPEEFRTVFQTAANESRDWERADLNQKNEDYLKIMQKSGMKVIRLSDDERAQLRDKTQPVWKEFGKDLSADLIKSGRDARDTKFARPS